MLMIVSEMSDDNYLYFLDCVISNDFLFTSKDNGVTSN
jgi:hypothetical protein